MTRRWFDIQFMPQAALSLGFHVDLKGPFLDVHLPFVCVRVGWLWWTGRYRAVSFGMGGAAACGARTVEGRGVKLHRSEPSEQVPNPDSVVFLCPGCGIPHNVIIDASAGRSCWTWNGSLDAPTFTPSILVTGTKGDRRCHSFVTDGRIQFLSDCDHALAGQTVDLPEFGWGE